MRHEKEQPLSKASTFEIHPQIVTLHLYEHKVFQCA